MSTEQQIAYHVEALIELGWEWEGRGLAPAWRKHELPAGHSRQLRSEQINHPPGHRHEA